MDIEKIRNFLKQMIFINFDEHKDIVSFVSDAHRKYAAKKLEYFKEEVIELFVSDLKQDATSETALLNLPKYYEKAERYGDIIQYLDRDYFINLLNTNQSLHSLYPMANLGLISAQKTKLNEAEIRFAIQKSVLNTLVKGNEIYKSEIEARMDLKDFSSAIALAQGTFLKEDRLQLLAIIAKKMKEQGLVVEEEILNQINLLVDQIDITALGERAIDIASDLIWVEPDVAIKIVEMAAASNKNDDRTLDKSFAQLSIAVLNSSDNSAPCNIYEKTVSKIKDPKIREFSSVASLFLDKVSISEIMTRIKKLDIKNQLFLLRLWAASNPERGDAAEIIDYGLNLLITNTQYTPTLRDLRELATPLPSIADSEKTRTLVKRFDSQALSMKNLGTNVDYVRLQLLLAQAESKLDIDSARNRIIELYWYVNSLSELATKNDCIAWIVATIGSIDPSGLIESKEGILSVALKDLKQYTDELLVTTAEHFHSSRGAIRALAKTKPVLSRLLCEISLD